MLIAVMLTASIPPRTPFVVLRVDGTDYKAGSEIKVRQGERIIVEAVLMGGKRDYCSNPNTYANVGRNTVVLSQGENGMSFQINNYQFTGDWKLTEEKANFSSGPEVKIKSLGSGNMQRKVELEFTRGYYSKVFLKVNSTTKWHYTRKTPGGKTEDNETNTGSATFYFLVETTDSEWYSSNNIKATGQEDLSVRNNLDRIQKYYDAIEKAMLEKNWSSAETQWGNLKTSLGELKTNIDRAKQKNENYECEITLYNLPSTLSMKHVEDLKIMAQSWKDCWEICSENVLTIKDDLLSNKTVFTNNVMKSIFKNYISWSGQLPTSASSILTLYDPKGIFTALDLPNNIIEWYTDAQNDASILKNQVNNMKLLNQLHDFYKAKMDNSINERRALLNILQDLKPAIELHNKMGQYISGVSSVKLVKK
ncbi:MAG: hypothetical protein QM212_03985 [Bacteroidota bacterium]|nr:hypothetical protein [Bacteroidota bacterium]NLP19929.1 hypothetical protein [Bacteroidales bacterium]HNY43917.1 hypothetical protein [Bacteroidales bacterium]HOD88508.1 hypothetical protein [Bacteroidales bacterium]